VVRKRICLILTAYEVLSTWDKGYLAHYLILRCSVNCSGVFQKEQKIPKSYRLLGFFCVILSTEYITV